MLGVRKVIDGSRGYTRLGPARALFDVDGCQLRYRGAFCWFVDVLRPDGDGWAGRALCCGREYGRFRLRRLI